MHTRYKWWQKFRLFIRRSDKCDFYRGISIFTHGFCERMISFRTLSLFLSVLWINLKSSERFDTSINSGTCTSNLQESHFSWIKIMTRRCTHFGAREKVWHFFLFSPTWKFIECFKKNKKFTGWICRSGVRIDFPKITKK